MAIYHDRMTWSRETLIEKLVSSLHLSVPERQMLGTPNVSFEEVAVVVRRVLQTYGALPAGARVWQPGHVVWEGFFLVKHSNGIVGLHWQRHHPINPAELVESGSSDFLDLDDAISTFIQKEWRNGIDGIPISLTASGQ